MESKETEKKKINRLIIIGNGFDLSLGMKTSYKDFLFNYLRSTFIKIYTEEESKPGVHYQDQFTYKYNDGLTDWKVPSDSSPYMIQGKLNELDDYDKLSNFLIKEKYLKYEYELLQRFHERSVLNNWTDIEILYYDNLVSIVKKYSDTPTRRESLIRIYNDKFNKLRLELIKYLSTKPWWSSNDVRGRDLDSVGSYYFNFFEKEILSSENDDVQNNKIMFLNFNYTSTVKDLLNKFGRVEDINHIHGKLNDEDSVIFGFDDKMDDNNNMLNTIRGNEVSKFIKSSHYIKYPNYTKLSG